MNQYQKSIKYLKKKLEENYQLTEQSWNRFANEKGLFSSITLQAHQDVNGWNALKNSLGKTEQKIEKQLEKQKKKLYQAIEKEGITSPMVIYLNHEIHSLWMEWQENLKQSTQRLYQRESKIYLAYLQSYQDLKVLTKVEGKFPTRTEWNHYAQENQLLSNQSIEYIAGQNWNQLRRQVLKENHLEPKGD